MPISIALFCAFHSLIVGTFFADQLSRELIQQLRGGDVSV